MSKKFQKIFIIIVHFVSRKRLSILYKTLKNVFYHKFNPKKEMLSLNFCYVILASESLKKCKETYLPKPML
jgi:hypothetical protein